MEKGYIKLTPNHIIQTGDEFADEVGSASGRWSQAKLVGRRVAEVDPFGVLVFRRKLPPPTTEYGWRMVKDGEKLIAGDEFWCATCSLWHANYYIKQNSGTFYRTKISPGDGYTMLGINESPTKESEKISSTTDGLVWTPFGKANQFRTVQEFRKEFPHVIGFRRRNVLALVGYGYAQVPVGAKIEDGDQVFSAGVWRKSMAAGETVQVSSPYRIAIAPGEGYEIVPDTEPPTDGLEASDAILAPDWLPVKWTHNLGLNTLADVIENYGKPLVFRRKKAVKVERVPLFNVGYGYHTVSRPDVRVGDEYKCDRCNGWHSVDSWNLATLNSSSAVRRKVDVGEGYELVPENAKLEEGQDVFGEFSEWTVSHWHKNAGCKTVRDALGIYNQPGTIPILAFRRKKVTAPVSNDRYIIAEDNGELPASKPYRPSSKPFVHTNFNDAIAEAQRLANAHGGKFAIFLAIDAYSPKGVERV
jgi:hypothetical protein